LQFSAETKAPPDEIYLSVLQWKGVAFAHQYQRRLQAVVPAVFAELREAALGKFDRREEVQQRLVGQRPEVAIALKAVTPEDLRKALPPDAVFIDFVEFSTYSRTRKGPDIRWQGEMRMAAFVVRRGQPTDFIDLGPSRTIAQAVQDWRVSIGVEKKPTEGIENELQPPSGVALPWHSPGLELQRLLWRPLRKAIGGAKLLLVSPDGSLSGFPFAALPTEDKEPESYLIRRCPIALVPTPQLLPQYLSDQPAKSVPPPSLLLVGDINYEAPPGVPRQAPSPVTARDLDVVFRNVETWPNMKDEVKRIGDQFRTAFPKVEPTVLDRDNATEQAFRDRAPGKRFIMLSTHGGYAGDKLYLDAESKSTDRKISLSFEMDLSAELIGPNPWQTCGIALTGANRGSKAGRDRVVSPFTDDGILTGMEIADLNLAGTDLVMISNCETGVGLSVAREGMVSVQRAFQVAGVRTTIATHWKVRGGTSLELTTAFFRNLWGKDSLGKMEALRQAQLQILDGGWGDSNNPRHWAAWSLSGHPGAAVR
jgi:CHAT domain-containing protein